MNEHIKLIKVGNINPSGNGMNGNVYHEKGLAPTITTNKGEGNKILVKDKRGDSFLNNLPLIAAIRGRYNSDGSITQKLEINPRGVSNTITTVEKDNMVLEGNNIENQEELYEGKWRIRKLQPIETWRLMKFTDEDFHKAEEVNSNSSLYRQAGNSIVVSVLEGIFSQMFKDKLPQTT